MVKVEINLDSQNGGVYFTGETVSGTIIVTLEQKAKFRAMSFVIHGRAKCHWTETEQRTVGTGKNRRTESHTVHYEGKNVYLHTKNLLFGSPGGQPIELPSGIHKYNFQFPLPPLIPASFEGPYGSIRYRVEAELDVPWGFDKEHKLQFTVARKDDLNQQPELKIPSRDEDIKTFCCLCCQSEPLITTVMLPFGGYVPGQDIPVKVNFVNKSDVDIERTKISLLKIMRFNSSTPRYKTRLEIQKVAEVQCDGVLRLQNKDIDVILTIPSILPTTNTMYCNVVQVSYEVWVEAQTQGCHKNIQLKTHIVLGSIPLLMSPSSPQPTFSGQPARATIPIQPFTDVQVFNGNYQQNTGVYPPHSSPPQPNFNIGFAAPYPPAMAPYDQPPTFDEVMGTKEAPVPNLGSNQTGWNYPSGQMPMPMPMASVTPTMPPYPVPVPQVQPSAPVSDEKH